MWDLLNAVLFFFAGMLLCYGWVHKWMVAKSSYDYRLHWFVGGVILLAGGIASVITRLIVNYPALTDGASWFNEGH